MKDVHNNPIELIKEFARIQDELLSRVDLVNTFDKNNIESIKELAWGCIVDAVSFTNWRAYQFENEEYLPAPIENEGIH